MDLYDQVKKQWQIWAVRSGEDLDLRLDNFRIQLREDRKRSDFLPRHPGDF